MSKKFAEDWADEWLSSPEGKELVEQANKEFLNYVVFGESTEVLNEDVIDEMQLDAPKIVEVFSEHLTEEQIQYLNEKDNNRPSK